MNVIQIKVLNNMNMMQLAMLVKRLVNVKEQIIMKIILITQEFVKGLRVME
jgi:hypothetical protein